MQLVCISNYIQSALLPQGDKKKIRWGLTIIHCPGNTAEICDGGVLNPGWHRCAGLSGHGGRTDLPQDRPTGHQCEQGEAVSLREKQTALC